MYLYKNRIVVTGGTGRFGSELNKIKTKLNLFFPKKNELNILNTKSISKYLIKKKPKYLIHLAGLSRPMNIHEKNIKKSIDLNIIGTANVTKVCSDLGVKLLFFSTSYVYPGRKGHYKEDSPLLPNNNYAWSKLGAESAVRMYKNSLIIRVSMTEKPFAHNTAFTNLKSNFMFHEDLVDILPKIINKIGIINIGGKSQSVYDFARKHNKSVKKAKSNKNLDFPLNQTMNLSKLKKLLKW